VRSRPGTQEAPEHRVSVESDERNFLSLTWQDLELDGDQPSVHVRKTLTWTGKVKDGSRRWTRAEPKTETARRTIDITPEVAEVLREHRTSQREPLFKLDQRKVARGDLVFTTALYAPVELHTFRSKIFKKALKRAAESLYAEDEGERLKMLKTRLYDLRHTMATLWLSEGIPIKVVSERLGHADITTTLSVYAHVLPGMQRDAVQRVAKAIGL
jgi:integrase